MKGQFSKQINDWALATPARIQAVWRRSVEIFAEELNKTVLNGGVLPHRTGNLHRSLVARVNKVIELGKPDQAFGGEDVGVAIATALTGDEIFLGWQAVYARRQNYGFVGEDSLGRSYNQEGKHFVERATKLWARCVAKANKEVESSVNAYRN